MPLCTADCCTCFVASDAACWAGLETRQPNEDWLQENALRYSFSLLGRVESTVTKSIVFFRLRSVQGQQYLQQLARSATFSSKQIRMECSAMVVLHHPIVDRISPIHLVTKSPVITRQNSRESIFFISYRYTVYYAPRFAAM